MLQRAASSAYSWWWASHIRTKQTKWLENNLQDIEEKVQYVLQLLEEEGDSFAKRAEMYYKRRPELISFVEEYQKAYRLLADRYDHISRELQKANTTIASVFPDQVPEFEMDEDDENNAVPPRFHKKQSETSNKSIPKVPELPKKEFKGMVPAVAKKFQPKKKSVKSSDTAAASAAKMSGLSKAEAVEEIDKLQKEILALQTEKEFVKGSYESGLAKYRDIEKAIKEKHDRICSLQDEFNEGVVIKDGEAQTLMAETAIKSCQEKVAELKQKQKKTNEEANIERKRIRELADGFGSISDKFLGDKSSRGNQSLEDEEVKRAKGLGIEEEQNSGSQNQKELESFREKIEEHFGANTSLTIIDMAEKIDELVNKVIGLETGISSQTALMPRLRAEIDDLQVQVRALQQEKLSLTDDNTALRNKLKEMEGKLKSIKDLDRKVEEHSKNLETDFTEANSKISCLSEKLRSLKPEGELEATGGSIQDEGYQPEVKQPEECEQGKSLTGQNDEYMNSRRAKTVEKPNIAFSTQKDEHVFRDSFKDQEENLGTSVGSENLQGVKAEDEAVVAAKDHTGDANQAQTRGTPENSVEEQASYEESGEFPKKRTEEMEDREKHLLAEYNAAVRDYKEVKRKLHETEVKLKNDNATKDEEIRFLRQELSLRQKGGKGDGDDLQEFKATENRQNQLIAIMSRDDNSEMTTTDHNQTKPSVEQQLRTRIDALLGKNLGFLVRCSAPLGRIQQFDTGIQDLQAEIVKINEQKKQDGGSTAKYSLRSDARPIYRHLKEIHTDLTVWLEKSWSLKEEIESRSSSLCSLEDEIAEALKVDSEHKEMTYTSYRAAKFQGEISNMKNENNRITDELLAGIDQVTTLQLEAERTLEKLKEEFSLSESMKRSNVQLQHSDSKNSIPLRSFLFDAKPKKQKPSIFACMHPLRIKKIRPGS